MHPSTLRLTVLLLILGTVAVPNLRPKSTPLATVELDNLAAWTVSHGPLELKTSATQGVLSFDFITAKEPHNNYVIARTRVDWTLPAKARIEIDARSRTRFPAYCALGLTAANGRQFSAVLSGDSKKGYDFTPVPETVALPLSRFQTSDGQALESDLRITEFTITFGLEANVNNVVAISRLQVLGGETPPLNNPPIIVNPMQNWTFQQGLIDLQTGFDEDGLRLAVATQPGPNNNYLVAALRHAWTLPESGHIDVEIKAAVRRTHYFALTLTTIKGRKFNAVFGGDPKRGFIFPSGFTTATIDLAQLKSSDGQIALAGTRIASVALTFAFEANLTNTLHISRLDLVSHDAD